MRCLQMSIRPSGNARFLRVTKIFMSRKHICCSSFSTSSFVGPIFFSPVRCFPIIEARSRSRCRLLSLNRAALPGMNEHRYGHHLSSAAFSLTIRSFSLLRRSFSALRMSKSFAVFCNEPASSSRVCWRSRSWASNIGILCLIFAGSMIAR